MPYARKRRVNRAPKPVNPLEEVTQRTCVKMAEAVGCDIYNLSQDRATRQTPGIPDLLILHTGIPVSFWFETKRPGIKRLSPAQQEFRARCLECGVRHYWGDVDAFWSALVEVGLATRHPVRGLILKHVRPCELELVR